MTTIASAATARTAFDAGASPHPTTAMRPVRIPAVSDLAATDQRRARLTGFLFLVTFATSIPPFVSLYVPALTEPAYVLGAGADGAVPLGALLEMMLIIANIGTAVVLFPLLRRESETLALGFVAARIIESVFIAVGILAVLALATLRLEGAGSDAEALSAAGRALVAVHDWSFQLGPGFIVGIGNGLILGILMWRTRLVPRAMSALGLVGGPALLAAAIAVLFGVIAPGSAWQVVATVPEFFWELALGVWLLMRGVDPRALAALGPAPRSGDIG